MRFLSPSAWERISQQHQEATKGFQDRQASMDALKAGNATGRRKEAALLQQIADLQQEVADIQQKRARNTAELEKLKQAPVLAPAPELKVFIERAIRMEKRLKEDLNAQLQADLKKLAPQDGQGAKLGTLLNCFQVSQEAILALADVDGSLFMECAPEDLKELCEEGNASEEACRDVVYCHEMLSNVAAPYEDHFETDCALCYCETTEGLLTILEEHKIDLDAPVLQKLNINGPRALTLRAADFPGEKRLAVMKKLHAVRAIHQMALE